MQALALAAMMIATKMICYYLQKRWLLWNHGFIVQLAQCHAVTAQAGPMRSYAIAYEGMLLTACPLYSVGVSTIGQRCHDGVMPTCVRF
mmetsp:Transcript_65408/g.108718  ORF Transcript_65408/g.108718 Transcript_65408/m.108718 type:complete len:89 (-) Transcript_65408:835-1101(-)